MDEESSGSSQQSGRPLASATGRANFPRRRRRRRPLPAPRSAPRCAPASRRAAAPGPAAAAGRWIRAAHQRTTTGRGERRKREGRTDGRKEKGGGLGVRYGKPRSPSDGRRRLGRREQGKVSELPPLHTNTYSTLCLWSVHPRPPPSPQSPFNLRKPYRQLTHSRQHPAYLFIQSGSGSGLLLICSLDSLMETHAHSLYASISI